MAQDTNSPAAGATAPIHIAAAEAAKHANEPAVVTGKVAAVAVRTAVVLLNFEKPYPDSPFSAVVFSRNTNKFGTLTNLEGKDVAVSGTIKIYKGKPEIIMTNAAQLTIVGAPAK
jgi:DNA/RNA endonuclease YhcR with UshA esterase domain